ncbi:MAG: thiosulfohydrolase SoxB [Cytophagales bacterium]|nr:thiosulfohydrolase SoxB [Cytophagales bacterium]
MSLSRREFSSVLTAAAVAGFSFSSETSAQDAKRLYDVPKRGNVHLLHMTDCHAQLLPIYFREPSINIGVAGMNGRVPHLVGEHLLKFAGIAAGSANAYAHTYLDFERAAHQYGKVGGFAHLATLVKQLKASRTGALLLDGGDTWQGSATSLWTNAQDMVEAAKLLGVDVMTAHWEFTFGERRVLEIIEKDFAAKGDFKGIDFIAQNVKTKDFDDPVFKPYVMKEMNGITFAIIGQAFPYTPIANPSWQVPNWTFGIQDQDLQKQVDAARAQGAQAVVLLSHNGMDVDLKLASRVTGIDAILGGHTHDGVPVPTMVKNAGGQTLVTNAGSNGKFLGVLDLDVRDKKVFAVHYKLLPVFANFLPADKDMAALIDKLRSPYSARLTEPLAITDGVLYRRSNFNGTFDQLILNALMDVRGAEIAFSPGFRWGTSLLSGQAITREHLMDQTAITYPWTTLSNMTGETIKAVLEDVADNLFNPDPYYQQGGDMVRTGGLQYTMDVNAKAGNRITDMRLNGKPIEANKTYKVAGWAPVQETSKNAGQPVWDVVETWLKDKKTIPAMRPNVPMLKGVEGNSGFNRGVY